MSRMVVKSASFEGANELITDAGREEAALPKVSP